jgi:hypothetical protein
MPQYGVAALSKPQNPEAGVNGLLVVVVVVVVVVVHKGRVVVDNGTSVVVCGGVAEVST